MIESFEATPKTILKKYTESTTSNNELLFNYLFKLEDEIQTLNNHVKKIRMDFENFKNNELQLETRTFSEDDELQDSSEAESQESTGESENSDDSLPRFGHSSKSLTENDIKRMGRVSVGRFKVNWEGKNESSPSP